MSAHQRAALDMLADVVDERTLQALLLPYDAGSLVGANTPQGTGSRG